MYTVISLSDSEYVSAKVDSNGMTMRIGELFGVIDGFRHEMVLPLTDELKHALRVIVATFEDEVDVTPVDVKERDQKERDKVIKDIG